MKQELVKMFELQDELNAYIDKNWKSNRSLLDWSVAIFIETAELIESLDWKWWKKQQIDLDNVLIEIVDIWHFGISAILNSIDDKKELEEQIELYLDRFYHHKTTPILQLSFVDSIKIANDIISNTLYLYNYLQYAKNEEKSLSAVYILDKLFKLAHMTGFSFENIYQMYVMKNVLNIFRQKNGYKEGKYVKIWNGLEDNQIANEIMCKLLKENVKLSDIPDKLMTELENYYKTLIGRTQ